MIQTTVVRAQAEAKETYKALDVNATEWINQLCLDLHNSRVQILSQIGMNNK